MRQNMFGQSLGILRGHIRSDLEDHHSERVGQVLPPQPQKRGDHLGNDSNNQTDY